MVKKKHHSVSLYCLCAVEKEEWLLLLLFAASFFHFVWKLWKISDHSSTLVKNPISFKIQ